MEEDLERGLFSIIYFLEKCLTIYLNRYIMMMSGGKATDRKAVDTMDEMKEVFGMTDKQFQTTLEQILLYAEKAENKQEIIEYLQKLIEVNEKA